VPIEVLPDAARTGHHAADLVCDAVRHTPGAWVGLPTGATPLPLYQELQHRHATAGCILRDLTPCAVDEFIDLLAGDGTNQAFYRRHLPFVADRFRCPDPASTDPERDIRTLAGEIAARGGLDLCVLGIGANGHIAFNEPGSPVESRARVVDLAPETRAAHAEAFGGTAPIRGMTLGVADLRASQRILVLATGLHKAAVVRRALRGPASADCPASWLQDHPDVTWLLDEAASALLT
jgi:glucosamine-6-phosphate deaminase